MHYDSKQSTMIQNNALWFKTKHYDSKQSTMIQNNVAAYSKQISQPLTVVIETHLIHT